MTPNEELINFIEDYKNNPRDKELESQFRKIKKYLRLNLYNDPSRVLTSSDINNLAFFGFWKAILKYDRNKWENAIGWCFYIIRQQILREINKTYKPKMPSIIRGSKSSEDDWVNNILENYSLYSAEESQFIIDTPIFYIENIQILCFELEIENVKASLTFQLKLCFPEITRDSIAKILGFKKRTGLAKIIKIIRAISKNHLDKELTSL